MSCRLLVASAFHANVGKVVVSRTSALGDDFQIADLHSADEQASGFGNYKRRTSLTLRHQSCMAQHFYQEIANCDAFVMFGTGWNTVKLPEKLEARQAVYKMR